ncbi:Putative transposable element, partial [Caligus rogercresseyi]
FERFGLLHIGRSKNVSTLKRSVNKAWVSMPAEYIRDVCASFRPRLSELWLQNGDISIKL